MMVLISIQFSWALQFFQMLSLYSAICIIFFIYFTSLYVVYLPSFYTFALNKWAFKSKVPNQELVVALKDLTEAPTVGQFFYYELINSCVTNTKWDQVLDYANLAVQTPINQNNFYIWYYKAIAECLLNRLEDCQGSARTAASLCSHNDDRHVSQLFNLAKMIKGNKKIKVMSSGGEVTIIIDMDHQKIGSQTKKEIKQENTQISLTEKPVSEQDQNQEPVKDTRQDALLPHIPQDVSLSDL